MPCRLQDFVIGWVRRLVDWEVEGYNACIVRKRLKQWKLLTGSGEVIEPHNSVP